MKSKRKYQSIREITNQLITYYYIPYTSSKEDALNNILSKISHEKNVAIKPQKKKTPISRFAAIAAAAVAALLIGIYFTTATIHYSGNNSLTTSYRLPDHSRVLLDKNGDLSFNRYFWNRKVKLNGTAYFEVKKGSNFKVKCKTGKVEVLGTRFLIDNSPQTISVKCYEGKVKTTVGNNTYILSKGEKVANAGHNQPAKIMPVENNYPELALFSRNYEAVYLKVIVDELEKFFSERIELSTGAERKFTGSVATGSINNALDIICTSMQLKYDFEEADVIKIYSSEK